MANAPVNLADPDVEPSDAELEGLVRRAFSGVRQAHEQSLLRLREDIARRRAEVLRSLESKRSEP
jgi:hypothetical protein